VNSIPGVDAQLMEAYVRGKPAYDQLFPAFYDRVADQVLQALQSEYPEIEAVVGPRDRANAEARFPEQRDHIPLDWVAFGFAGMDMYDFHVGTVLDFSEWPVTYRQGLHIADELYELARGGVDAIDWKTVVGVEPAALHQVAIREYQWLDPRHEFDFADIESQAARMAQRIIAYYKAAVAIAYQVRTELAQ